MNECYETQKPEPKESTGCECSICNLDLDALDATAHKPKESSAKSSARATLHCLTGCVIGEVLGLFIGVHFALGTWPTMLLATALAFIVGFSLAISPLMRAQNLSFSQAFNAIWLGEIVSIGTMEIAMNAVDYYIGGVQAASLSSPIFYIGIAFAIPAGFLSAWPVNYILLKKQIKKACH